MALRFSPLANLTGPAGLIQQPVTPEQSILARQLLEAKRAAVDPRTDNAMRPGYKTQAGELETALIARKDQSRLNELPPGPMPPPGDVTVVEKGAVQERPPSSFGTLATGDQIREAFQRRQQQMAPPEMMVAAAPVPTGMETQYGRPLFRDPQGGEYSEKTVTIPYGGGWVVAPSVAEGGRIMTEDEVAEGILKNGPFDPLTGEKLSVFPSIPAADNYARRRSETMQYRPRKAPGATSSARPQPTAVDMANMQADRAPPGVGSYANSIPYDGRTAAVRYNNPGAAWPSERALAFGMTGYGVLNDGEGNKIARFSDPAHGAAYNMDLLARKYRGMTIGDAVRKWRGGRATGNSIPAGYKSDTVLSDGLLRDRGFMTDFFGKMAQHEGRGGVPLPPEKMDQAFNLYAAGGFGEGATNEDWVTGDGAMVAGAQGAPSGAPMAYSAENTMTPQGSPQNALVSLLMAQQAQQPMPYSSPDWVPLTQAAPRTELAQSAPIAQGGNQVAFTPQVASPEQIEGQGALAAAMLARGQRGDAAHPMQAIGNTAQAAAGAFGLQRARQMENQRRGALAQALMAARGGGSLDQLYGVDPRVAFELEQQRIAADAEARQAQLQRQWEMEDYERKKQIDQRYAAPKDPPSDVQEYEYARRQMIESGATPDQVPDYTTWSRENRKSGASNVTVGGGKYGPIPSGEMLVEDENGARLVQIPGGKAAREQEEAQQQAAARQQMQQATGNLIVEDIGRAYEMASESPFWTTGVVGDLMSNVGGTQARDLRGLITTIGANISFGELQKMRDNSPTGGALGQVTPRELELLQATKGDIEQSQSDKQLLYNLSRLNDQVLDTIHGPSWRETNPELSISWREANRGQRQTDGPTATNPQTGQKLILRNGQWVPIDG